MTQDNQQGFFNNGLVLERVEPSQGERFSPNMYKWLKSLHPAYLQRLRVCRNSDGALYVVIYQFEFGTNEPFFSAVRVYDVLCNGSKSILFSYTDKQLKLTELPQFWSDYMRIGRCAIDADHTQHFLEAKHRWSQKGDDRNCTWCGKFNQTLKRWTEAVERTNWVQSPIKGTL